MSAQAASSVAPRFRSTPRQADVAAVRTLAAGVEVFTEAEQTVAVELLEERLRTGPRSGYFFTFADLDGALAGYSAWGPIPMTAASYDLYWIVVDPALQGSGLGRKLLELTERAVQERGGRRLYIETSSRPHYRRTRRFYRLAGYRQVARLEDFYAPGDHKIMFCKAV